MRGEKSMVWCVTVLYGREQYAVSFLTLFHVPCGLQ